MLAAGQANQFTYKAGSSGAGESELPATEALTNRLLDLDIGKTAPPSIGAPTAPEKETKTTTSSSRPLTVEDDDDDDDDLDDLDLDLEIDDTIDTTVSLLYQYRSMHSDLFFISVSSSLTQPFFVHADVNKYFRLAK